MKTRLERAYSPARSHAVPARDSQPGSTAPNRPAFEDRRQETISHGRLQSMVDNGSVVTVQRMKTDRIQQAQRGAAAAQPAPSASEPVCQLKWIDDRTGPYYEWDTHLDGVQWYALKEDPDIMFYTIVDPETTDEDVAKLAGVKNAKHRSEWVEHSGSDPYAQADPSLILIPTEPELKEELKAVTTKGQALKPFVPSKSVYVLSPERNDSTELMQYVPTGFMTEYIFDYKNNIFATGERAPSWITTERHPYIAKEAKADLKHLAGGMLRVMGDQIFTNEASGHYGENWTPQIRDQFKKLVRRLFPGKAITHSADYRFNAADPII
jgi:hypothetical protein